jgi:predicted ATPase
MDSHITALEVEGFKSLHSRQRLEVKPLTIIAGANSSGKSSLMQPMLLLKQTLESSFTTSGLLLDGDHLKYTKAPQLLSLCGREASPEFRVRWIHSGNAPDLLFIARPERAEIPLHFQLGNRRFQAGGPGWNVSMMAGSGSAHPQESPGEFLAFRDALHRLLHLPGLRGNPMRAYPVTAARGPLRGPFPPYTGSVLLHWQDQKAPQLKTLLAWLKRLDLAVAVEARELDESRIEVQVSRGAQGRAREDLVSIADVGVGVSQTLPLLVALLAAEPGSWVYVEQPETHLHPKAQALLAGILVEAATSLGVRVIAETHSSILIQEIQTLVAQGQAAPGDVGLHWCQRSPRTGATKVTQAVLDEMGSFGDWPADFGETALAADQRYLEAIARRRSQ